MAVISVSSRHSHAMIVSSLSFVGIGQLVNYCNVFVLLPDQMAQAGSSWQAWMQKNAEVCIWLPKGISQLMPDTNQEMKQVLQDWIVQQLLLFILLGSPGTEHRWQNSKQQLLPKSLEIKEKSSINT